MTFTFPLCTSKGMVIIFYLQTKVRMSIPKTQERDRPADTSMVVMLWLLDYVSVSALHVPPHS